MKFALKLIIPFVFIALAWLAVKVLVMNREANPPRKPVAIIPQADVVRVEEGDHQPPVVSYGTVQSYYETTVTPQVSGQIVELAAEFRVGNLVGKGAVLAQIDDTDYLAAHALESSNLATAKRTLAEEEIRAQQAAEDWVASGRDLAQASDFVLRKPQLSSARAVISSSEAAVQKAQADIARAVIRAPYDAVVLSRTASVGDYATQQQSLGSLVATERVEVRLPLTADQASRVNLPGRAGEEGPGQVSVTLSSASKKGVRWQGRLVRTEPAVDPRNQVTYVIAEVLNPYAAKPEPLVVGTFVNVSIPAKTISRAYKVPESTLVNDSFVWCLTGENKLCRVSAVRVHGDRTSVFLQLPAEELRACKIKSPLRIVTRPLSTFKSGDEVKPVLASTEQ